MADKKTTANYSLFHDLRRFGVEALCLLMLLYGAPLQALDSVSEPMSLDIAEASSTQDEPSWVEPVLESAGHTLDAVQSEVHQLAVDIASQPWTDAFSLLFTASHIGASGAGSSSGSAPPSPPKDDARPSKDYDLASLAAGFFDKNALDAVPLLPGWNQVSLPEIPTSSDPATALNAIGGSYHKVYAYNGCDAADPWKVYDPNDLTGSDLAAIGVEQGLLIDATAAVGLPSDGTLPDSTTIQLCTGWNLIGFPSAYPRHVKSALAPILDKVVRVYAFDPFDLADNWKFYEASAPAWASDLDTMVPGMGYWVLVTEDVQLEIKNVGDAPSIAFSSPQDLDVVTAPTEIQGTVASDLLDNWQLRYRGVGENDWIGLANGNYPVQGKLGDFDPTLLLNGMYELELVATDLQGQQVTDSIAIVVEGNMKIGHFTLSFIDLAIPLSGLDIQVVRTYDSRQRHMQGDFGYGWSLDIRQGSYRNNRPPGDSWRIPPTEGPWGLPCSTVQELKSHLTTVRLSDQEVYRFRLTVKDPGTIIGGCIGRAEFEFVDGPVPGATLEILGNDEVLYQNNSDELRDPNSFALFVPEDVKLTTRDGRIFHLDLADGVTHLEDLNGNTLEITPEGITHSSGRGVEFERDAEGRIERIIDPMGNANVYAYDDVGDHVTFTDRIGAVTTFAYADGHYLEDIVNALGVRAVRTEYDEDGRMVRVIDAAGQPLEFGHDLDSRQIVVTNRLGANQIFEYDHLGNVVRQVNALGETTERSYDPKGRLLAEQDALGNKVTYAYGSDGLPQSVKDPAGGTFIYSRDARGRLLAITDPLGGLTTITYDSSGNLLSTTDPTGAQTQFNYNEVGDPISIVDALGQETSMQYISANRVSQITNPLGSSTGYSYDPLGGVSEVSGSRTTGDGTSTSWLVSYVNDSLGRRVTTTLPDESTSSTVFNEIGLIKEIRDTMGRITTLDYDSLSRLVSTNFPDGSSEKASYDLEGRVRSRTDRDGKSTTFEYDATGRLTRTIFPDGSSLQRTFDAAGRLIATTNQLGASTLYTYDPASRVTRITDALGNSTALVYDAVGNRIEEVDAIGRRFLYLYDPIGRLVKTVGPNGFQSRILYDPLGRLIRKTDANGLETNYKYDASNRLAEVIDPLGGVTHYLHDELGNRIAQTDPLGRTTRFEYDYLGRVVRRVLPDGSAESFTYDHSGRILAHVELDGSTTQHLYDGQGRLTETAYSDGSQERYTYTPSGKIASVRDARGLTHYTYDDAGRRVATIDPEGWTLENTSDRFGNRLSTTTHLGSESLRNQYSYDAVGRLLTVEDALGRSYSYRYDAAGQMTSLTHPDASTTIYTYDPLGHLVGLQTRASSGDLLQSHIYTLDLEGNRLSVQELDQTIRTYDYDSLYRLVRESVELVDGELSYENEFSYDAVGNRIQLRKVDRAGLERTYSYRYDSRDRLLEQASGSEIIQFEWDINGRLLGKSALDSAGILQSSVQYIWGPKDRLTEVLFDDGTQISLDYDHRRKLWKRGIRNASGESRDQRFIVEDSGPYSQVFGTLDAEDKFSAQYTHGANGQALGGLMFDTPKRLQYHTDALGSVRLVTSDAGLIVSRHDYEAFGESTTQNVAGYSGPRFAGEFIDSDTKLYNLRARWMDPSQGRFLSIDPVLGDTQEPITHHRYLYAGAQPVNNIDPTGKFFISINVGFTTALGITYLSRVVQRLHQEAILPPLPAAETRALEAAKAEILLLNPESEGKCQRKVIDRLAAEGFTLDGFKTYLQAGTHFLDGTRSLAHPNGPVYPNAASAKSFLIGWGLPENALLQDVFAQGETRRLNALTSITRPQLTVFFRPSTIEGDNIARNSGLLFHEGLHGFSYSQGNGWGDTLLKQILELSSRRASAIISSHISDNCF